VVPALIRVIDRANTAIDELERHAEPTWNALMKPMEDLMLPFDYAWKPVIHLLNVKNAQALREAHKQVLPEVVAVNLRLQQSRILYSALKAMKEGPEWQRLDEPRRRAVALKLREAELAGAGLEGKARERFTEMEKELSLISTDFFNNVLDATKAFDFLIMDKQDTQGWPESLRQLTAQSFNSVRKESEPEAIPESGPWRITLDVPCYLSFMQHSKRRDHRECLYRAFVTRASKGGRDNTELIARILRLRKEKARLLGFNTYAELSLASKTAGTVGAVHAMLEELAGAARAHAVSEFQELAQLALESGQSDPLKQWDIHFWAERLRERKLGFTDDQLRPYFTLSRVLGGLFALSRILFGISIHLADGEAAVWHPDVRYFKVCHPEGGQIASFYLDPCSRPHEKRGGAWIDTCLGRRRLDGSVRLPVVFVCCNAMPPVGNGPPLMSFPEVQTLFHEFGHSLQAMLTTVDFSEVSGVNGIEWDAVEMASQFMENWCYHRPTLKQMSAHVDTGEPLPDDLIEKICASRTFRSGSLMMRQLELATVDMRLHHEHDPAGKESASELYRQISERMSPIPPIGEDRFLCGFLHIFSGYYAAGYYSYKWSEVMSADIFEAFEEAGMDDEKALARVGRRLQETVFALGGSRHPLEVFRDFRGRAPRMHALLRHRGLSGNSCE
jgi:oligopeptidase A